MTHKRKPSDNRQGEPDVQRSQGKRPLAYRWLTAAAWVVGGMGLFAFFLRISLGSRVDSDGANSALQAWYMLHGHLLLSGWRIGDATFYAFDLPVNAIAQAIFGLGNLAAHAGSALVYTLVAVSAAALAMIGSSGPARLARAATVVTVLGVPLLTAKPVTLLLEEPDHIGTSVFVIGSLLLIDLAAGRRFTAPLLCVILTAGEFGDLTVRYVAVPAVVLVCGGRALAGRRLRSQDTALAAAALISVPLEMLARAVTVRLGGFLTVPPKTAIVPVGQWPHHAMVTWLNLRMLFGAIGTPTTRFGALGSGFGMACLLAAVYGLARVAWTSARLRASRTEQMLCVAIAFNICTDLVSPLATPGNAHELATVLPCGAVLAARALVPARIARWEAAFAAVAVSALAAVIPLTSAATQPVYKPVMADITDWLVAHRLTYGLSGYWDASLATVQSGGRVAIRDVEFAKPIGIPGYEVDTSWYDPTRHDATFVLAHVGRKYPPAKFEWLFGNPAKIYKVGHWVVLVYQKNLLWLFPPGSSN